MTKPHEVLFMDWTNVGSGSLDATLDSSRLSESGKKQIELYARDFGIHFDQTGHGLRRKGLPFGVKVTIEKAKKSDPWLISDLPWEGNLNFITVIQEDGIYRSWYECMPRENQELVFEGGRAMESGKVFLNYAESADGFTWKKPSLGLVSLNGSASNNVVSTDANAGTLFRDDSADPDERYKLFFFDRLHDVAENTPVAAMYGIYGAVSPDGFRWTRIPDPLVRYFCDTQNIGCWDPVAKEYVGYFRSHVGGRSISRSTTKDFRKWPAPETILYPGPEDAPADDYYTNCFTHYPGNSAIKLMFPAIYHHNDSHVDVRSAISGNGLAFNWLSHEPIIDIGKYGDWDCGSIYACPNMVRLPDGRLALPYFGINLTHEEDRFRTFYEDFEKGVKCGYAWALWDDGRLAGIESCDYGEFYAEPVLFEGDMIEINARTTRSGDVEVELCEESSKQPMRGFSFADGTSFVGDEIWAGYGWKNDLSKLKGKRISLHFRLSSAKVFGYRLR